MFENDFEEQVQDSLLDEEDYGLGEFIPATILPESFIDHIAHKTKSSVVLNQSSNHIQFEKVRFRIFLKHQTHSLNR